MTRRTVPLPLRLKPSTPFDEKSKGTSARVSPSRVIATTPEVIGESKDRVTRAIPEAGVGVGGGAEVTVPAPVARVERLVVRRV